MDELSRRDVLKSGALMAPALLGLTSFSASAADPYEDAVLLDGEPPKLTPGAYTIAVLPDTQFYSQTYPQTYIAQTNWIVENKAARNIACVLHLGDITNNNTVPEWVAAQKAMQKLDGHVPYFMVPGNHDYSAGGGCKDRTTLMSEYFPVSSFKGKPTFGGVYDKEPERIENSYHTFTVGQRKFLVIALEFGPRRDVVRWANDIAARHPEHSAILITHVYMYHDDTRYDWKGQGKKQAWNPHGYAVAGATKDDVMDGEELWTELVSKHKNFIMTLNGHVLKDGLGRLSSKSPSSGHDVHQMLVNFQMRPKGGDGWLRLLEFREDSKLVQVYDYSPMRKQRNESGQNQFTLGLA
ncbi:MAG: metallophosphoesterase [Planctomycetota bacterium]